MCLDRRARAQAARPGEPDEAFCAALETATGGNPLFVGAARDAVTREGASPTAEHAACLPETGAQGVSRAVGLHLARLQPEALALLRAASVLGDGIKLRHVSALAGVNQASLVRPPRHSSGLTSSVARIRRSSSTPSSAALSTRRSMWSSETPRTAWPRNCCSRPAPRRRVRRGTCCAWPHRLIRSWSRRSGKRPSALAQGAADAAVGYLTRALEEQLDPAARAEVLVELGPAERRTNGPAAAGHLRAGLELLADPARRGEVALELGRALWFTDRIGDALAAFGQALNEVDRERDPDLYELLEAELISSAWWDPRTYPVAEAAIGELNLDALHGGLGSEILLATMAHYEYRLGCTASSRSAWRGARSRPGTWWRAARSRSFTRW
jgi:hypothetical protein